MKRPLLHCHTIQPLVWLHHASVVKLWHSMHPLAWQYHTTALPLSGALTHLPLSGTLTHLPLSGALTHLPLPGTLTHSSIPLGGTHIPAPFGDTHSLNLLLSGAATHLLLVCPCPFFSHTGPCAADSGALVLIGISPPLPELLAQ